VCVRHDIEGVSADAIGSERYSFQIELVPSDHLAGEEERAENQGSNQPRQSAQGGRATQAEPLLHRVNGVEHAAAGDLHCDGAEKQGGRVEPQYRRNCRRKPLADDGVIGVEVTVGLRQEEHHYDAEEEHEHGG